MSCLSPWCAGSAVSLTLALAVFVLVLAEAALDLKKKDYTHKKTLSNAVARGGVPGGVPGPAQRD